MTHKSASAVLDPQYLSARANDLRFADFMHEIVACFDPQLRHVYVNSAVERFTGRPSGDFIGKTNRDLGMPTEQVEQWDKALGEVFRSGQADEIQFSFDTPEGERLFVSQLLPQTDSQGAVTSVITIARELDASRLNGLTAEHFKAIIESSDDAIIGKTLAGIVTSWNHGAEIIFGYSQAEMLGRSLLILFPEDRQDEERFIVEKILLGERVDHFETVRIRKDGTPVHVSVTISPIRDSDGSVIGASKVVRDITPIKVERERLQMALDAANNGLWDWNLGTGHVYRSAQYYQISGYNAEDDTHDFAFFQRTVHPLDWARVQEVIGEHIAGKRERIELEFRLISKTGDTGRWVAAKGQAVERNSRGEPIRIVGTLSDITQSKLLDLALREHEQRLSRVLEGSDQGYWDWDLPTNNLLVSARWETMLGYEPGEMDVTNGRWAQVVHPEDLPRTMELVYQHMRGETDKFESEMRCRTKSGGWRWILSRGKVVQRDAHGNAQILSGTHSDITEQKRNQEALQTSLCEKEALLKEVHHRVKNNLQVITSLLRLEAGRSTVADTKSVLGDMKGRIHAMAQLHESLYRSGTLASIDLGSYLSRLATQVFQTQGPRTGLVQLKVDTGTVQVGMDQATVGGLLLNELVTNGLKHGFPEGRSGEVHVRLQPVAKGEGSDAKWSLCVSDTGIGLSADFEEKRDTSLGLQLVGDLSKQLGGTLTIGAAPDGGAMFEVVFTVQEPAALVMPV